MGTLAIMLVYPTIKMGICSISQHIHHRNGQIENYNMEIHTESSATAMHDALMMFDAATQLFVNHPTNLSLLRQFISAHKLCGDGQ